MTPDIQRILAKMEEDLSYSINKFLINENNPQPYPLKIENDYGTWEIFENGKILLQPKVKVEYLTLNFTVLPNGIEKK